MDAAEIPSVPVKGPVLLIDPPWVIDADDNFWKNIGSCLPSLGLAYIASYLEARGHAVEIMDCTAMRYGLADIERLFKLRAAPPALLGITATTPLIENALAVAAACKRLFPGTKVVLGGVHPTVLPGEVLAHPAVDIVARGEGEETMLEIAEGRKPGEILGISFKEDGRVVHNPDRPLIKDLDTIPPPAYHLLPMDRYYPATGSYRNLPAMSLFATRGCPGRCTFCYRTFYGRLRKRSAANIVAEVELLYRNYGIREIAFYDDAFTSFKETVFEFCDLLHKRGLKLTWTCFTRVDLIDEELLRAMKKAGCHLILFGVESGDERILKAINKRIDLGRVKEAVAAARRIGIDTRASFMLGNQGETEESVRKTIDFAFELDPDQVHFNIATAYPGTELYNWARENGYLTSSSWSDHNMSEINLRLPTISPERLKYYYARVHGDFYFRPRIVLRRLFKIRTLAQLRQEVRGFLALLRIFGGRKERG